MIILMDRPLTNDHPKWPAACKRSSGWISLLQMIIRMDQPFANDHPDWPASCKWSSFSFSVILLLRKKHIFLLQIFSSFSFTINLLPCKKHIFRLQIYSSFFFLGFVLPWKNIFLHQILSPFYFSSVKKILLQISSSFSFSVHLLHQRPQTQNSRIIGQYIHNLLDLIKYIGVLRDTARAPQPPNNQPAWHQMKRQGIYMPMKAYFGPKGAWCLSLSWSK